MPTTVYVDVKLTMPKRLRKDLQENEIVCPWCKGLGIQKREQNYGLRSDPPHSGFPHRYEYFIPCNMCYNGIVKTCKYCGQPSWDKNKIHAESVCGCEGAQKDRDAERTKRETEQWDKAKKITIDEAIKTQTFLFVDGFDEYVEPDELEDWICDQEDLDVSTLRVYGTTKTSISFNADNIVEEALCDLHEDANDNISGSDVKELQNLLDDWAEEHKSGTDTYYPDWEVGILLEGVFK